VTALFADLVDYVRLVAEHDAEDVRRRVDAALVAMVEAIEAFDGTREKFIGDAVFAVFGWPVGHDDDALRAAHCALAIRERLANLEDPAGGALQVRIGLASGEVVAAPRGVRGALDWSLTGPAITTAARIQDLANPGEILLDEATRRAARKELVVDDLGERLLRGQTRPIRIGRLIGDASFQPWRQPMGRFVGRSAERGRIRAALNRLAADWRGGVILVEGEAGIGKSRLLADAEAEARRLGLEWTWVDNVSYGAAEPYRFARALAQVIADEHGTDSGSFARFLLFDETTTSDDARRWAGAVAAIARDAAFSGWEAEAAFVPPDAVKIAQDLRSVAERYVTRLIDVDGPRVIVVDDLHWMDRSSTGIFNELVRLTTSIPFLVLIGARPGVDTERLAGVEVERIELSGLDLPETGELAAAVAGVAVDPEDVRQLHAQTGGNPLFIGETVRAILDDGWDPERGVLGLSAGSGAPVPVTLRALLGARIDALADDARNVLRVSSVIGYTFHEATVGDLMEEPVAPGVYERLAEAAMIVPADSGDGWRFCHPLIHDVAYAGILATRRRFLHGRVADWLDEHQPDGLVTRVARHRAAAGDGPRAIPLLVKAAESAIAMGAPTEASGYLERAAELSASPAEAERFRRRAAEAREAEIAAGRPSPAS
jgi:class 3 adenylate cyclase